MELGGRFVLFHSGIGVWSSWHWDIVSRYIAIYVNYIHHLKTQLQAKNANKSRMNGMILNLLFELHFSRISECLSLAYDILVVACSFIFLVLFIFIFCDSLLYSPYLGLNA